MPTPVIRMINFLLTGIGILVALAAILKTEHIWPPSGATLFVFTFTLGPWLIAGLLARTYKRNAGLAIGLALMLAFEAACYFETFIHPTSSTSALVYVVKPFYQLLGCLPLGLALDFAWRWIRRRIKPAP